MSQSNDIHLSDSNLYDSKMKAFRRKKSYVYEYDKSYQRCKSRSTSANYCSKSRSAKRRKAKRPRIKSLAHKRYQSINKEDRILSTWNKIEIAEWLETHWDKSNSSHINKIKREKRFDGKNIDKLNDRYLNILAKRYLGLKKGDIAYNEFIKSMHELKYSFSSKNVKLHKERCPKQRKRHSVSYPSKSAEKMKPNHVSKFPYSTNSYPTEYKLNLSVTSPAESDEMCGVTDDELLQLISMGQCDSDYDTDSYIDQIQSYIYQNTSRTPSPKDAIYRETDHQDNDYKNKTIVIPSLLTVSLSMDDAKDDTPPIICLSPNAARNGNMTRFNMIKGYSIDDESTDDDAEYDLRKITLHDIKD